MKALDVSEMEGKVGLASDRTAQRRDPASGSPTALLRGEKRNPRFSRAAMFTVSHTHAFNIPASAAQSHLEGQLMDATNENALNKSYQKR